MARKIGEAFVQVRPSTDGFEHEATGKLKAGLVGVMKVVGVAAAAAFTGALALGISSVKSASDLNETVSKTNVIFDKTAASVFAFAETADKSFGISKQSALDASASFALFAKSAGLTGQSVVGFSTKMTGLASDLASFFNTSPEDAIQAIGAALRGESEPIRRYNVLLDDATLRQAALRLGLIKTTKNALTPQQRILAAQAEILRQTSAAQGDFARTSGGLANQQRIASAAVANLRAKIGTALLPVVTSLAVAFNSQLIPALEALWAKHGPKVTAFLQKAADGVGKLIAGLQGKGPIDGFSGSVNTLGLGLRALVQAFKDGDVTSDGFVGKMETIGAKLHTFFAQIKSGDTEGLAGSFTSAADSGKKLVPVIEKFIQQMPSFADLAKVGATVLKFFADHADTLAKIMPILVGAIVAYKVAQLAANVALLLSVPAKIAEVVVNRQLIRSNRELIASRIGLTVATVAGTGATVANTGAESVGILTRARAVAAMVAQRIASVAVRTATIAWTAVQWLLNAALTANPIGLVIVAIAALVAAIIWIATKTTWFQTAWNAAWGGIKAAAKAVADWFTGPFVQFFRRAWDFLKNLVVGGVRFYTDRLLDLVGFFRALPGRILSAIGDLGQLLVHAGKRIIDGLLDGIASGFNKVKDKLKQLTDLLPDWKGPLTRDRRLLFGPGRAIMDGLREGMNAGIPSIESLLGGLTNTIGGGPQLAVAGGPPNITLIVDGRALDSSMVRVLHRNADQVAAANIQGQINTSRREVAR